MNDTARNRPEEFTTGGPPGPAEREVCRLVGVQKLFPSPTGRLDVLKGIDLAIRTGEMVSVIGPSGVGKSTLLHIVGALDPPSAGEITIAGCNPYSLSEGERARLRNSHIGFVFQFHHLLAEFTALENVAMPLLVGNTDPGKAFAAAEKWLAAVGLRERAHHRPGKLSGGEQQRVAVARALVSSPAIVLADEPSGNLDETNAVRLHELLTELRTTTGRALLIATHNPDLSRRSDRVFRIVDGRLQPEVDGPMAPHREG